MKPCIKVVHIATELKGLMKARSTYSIDPIDFYRQLGNLEEKIDALMCSGCPHITEKDPDEKVA